MITDRDLLRRYLETGSQAAFTELAHRYAGLVYSVALRATGDNAALAEDVAQTIFVDLARKAGALVNHDNLAGWLHTATRYASRQALRDFRRRKLRELAAGGMDGDASAIELEWERLRPVLDEAVGDLAPRDREAVLLRFYQDWSHREVGRALGLTEDAARMRVERALERLRLHFSRRGVKTSAALLGAALAVNSVEALPAGLAGLLAQAPTAGGAAGMAGMGATTAGIPAVAPGWFAILGLVGCLYFGAQAMVAFRSAGTRQDSLRDAFATGTLAPTFPLPLPRFPVEQATQFAFTIEEPPADRRGIGEILASPAGVAVDQAGNVYVADPAGNTIRKIAPTGGTVTLAGTPGMAGSADGMGGASRFNRPAGVAIDGAGNVYVADQLNHTIRKIAANGMVTTLAGDPGVAGSADGAGGASRFNHPAGVAIDGAGNVYVADQLNHTIRKIAPNGMVTTLAGTPGDVGSVDGMGGVARFNQPSGVAVDRAGVIYVADRGNHAVRKIASDGTVRTLVAGEAPGGNQGGEGKAIQFVDCTGVAVDGKGDLYVADVDATIREIGVGGEMTTLALADGQRIAAQGDFTGELEHQSGGIAADAAGDVFAADILGDTVVKLASSGAGTAVGGRIELAMDAPAGLDFPGMEPAVADGSDDFIESDLQIALTLQAAAPLEFAAYFRSLNFAFGTPGQGTASSKLPSIGALGLSDGNSGGNAVSNAALAPVGASAPLLGIAPGAGGLNSGGTAGGIGGVAMKVTGGGAVETPDTGLTDPANPVPADAPVASPDEAVDGDTSTEPAASGTGEVGNESGAWGSSGNGGATAGSTDPDRLVSRQVTGQDNPVATPKAPSTEASSPVGGGVARATAPNDRGSAGRTVGAGPSTTSVGTIATAVTSPATPVGGAAIAADGDLPPGSGSAPGPGGVPQADGSTGSMAASEANAGATAAAPIAVESMAGAMDRNGRHRSLASGDAPTTAPTAGSDGSAKSGDFGSGGRQDANASIRLIVDARGNLYLANGVEHTIRSILPSGTAPSRSGTGGAAENPRGVENGQSSNPMVAVMADAKGDYYVAADNGTIQQLLSSGPATDPIGSGGTDQDGGLVGKAVLLAADNGWEVDSAAGLDAVDSLKLAHEQWTLVIFTGSDRATLGKQGTGGEGPPGNAGDGTLR